MKKIEVHCKTKYSFDYDSTIDVNSILWNSLDNGEKGIIFIDKYSPYCFYKIETIYHELCDIENKFNDYKIGYGVELTTIIDNKDYQINLLLKNNNGKYDLYKLLKNYIDVYDNKIPFNEVNSLRNNLVIGIIINDSNIDIDLSLFDYIEINKDIQLDKYKDKLIVYSNKPNAIFEGELIAKEVLYQNRHIKGKPICRLYMDTEDTLKIINNKDIVVDNSNKLLEMLDRVTINEQEFYTTKSNFKDFKTMVIKAFNDKFNNPSKEIVKRLNDELMLIDELNYTYYYLMALDIINYVKEGTEYYQIDSHINNSLVAFVLGITNIDSYNLPYELFFSKIPDLTLSISNTFWTKKLFAKIMNNYNLIRCNYGYKINKDNVFRILKNYEIMTKKELNLAEKDYISNILLDIPIYMKGLSNTFYVIPNEKESIVPFTENGTIVDYHDLKDNFIKITILPNELYNSINNMFKTGDIPKLYNDKKVYDLYRSTDSFNIKYKILDKKTGILNTGFDYYHQIEDKLLNIPNLWFDDLINIYMKCHPNEIIIDDVYNSLKNNKMEEKDIFLTINSLKQNIFLIPKALVINRVKYSYLLMYYKLYHPKTYYYEMLNYLDSYHDLKEIGKLTINEIIDEYHKEKNDVITNKYVIYELLIEMYERGISFIIKDGIIKIGE